MFMSNMSVILLMCLPFMVYLGLKYFTFRRNQKIHKAEEINSILIKHSKKPSYDNVSDKDNNKKAA